MNAKEASSVLAALSAAWPSHDMPEDTVRLWVGLLADVELPDAMAAARVVVKQDRFFPPISRYLQECEAQSHGRRNRLAAERGLPRNHQTVAPPPRLVAMLRDTLAQQRTANHWHGGPDPCPICGGMAPTVTTARRAITRASRPTTGTPLKDCGIRGCRTCTRDQL